MFQNYVKIALRNIKRQKTYSFINITGLAIGMACSILIMLWVQDELSFDQFHQNKNEIYRVVIDFEDKPSIGTCGALAPALQAEIPEIQSSARLWNGWPSLIHYKEKKVKQIGRFADPSVFEIFTFPLITGNPQTALEDKHAIVLTESVAKKLFREEDPLGKTVRIPNRWGKKETFFISGVIQDLPRYSHIQFDFLFSFNLLKEWYSPDFAETWRNYSFTAYVFVNENTNIADLNTKITACYNRHTKKERKLHLQPLSEIYTDPILANHLGAQGNINTIRIFTAIAAFILLIACVNFMNLATALSIRRAKEVGLRKVIGANKVHIVLHYWGEAVFLAIMALPLAILLLELVIPHFNELTGKNLALNYLDSSLLPAVLGTTAFTGLIAGSYPALFLSRFQPIHSLKHQAPSLGRSSAFRKALVVFQFVISIAIVIATMIASHQMRFVQEKDLGFDKSNLLYTWTTGYQNEAIRNELLKDPNIISVGGSGAQLDFIGWWSSIKDWQGRYKQEGVSTGILEVGYEYLNTYKFKMVEGRFYSKAFPSDELDAVVLNEAAAKAMQMETPIGKKITLQGESKRIIGIVQDFHFQSLHSQITPIAFVLYPKKLPCLGIRIKPEKTPETVAYIKTVLAKFLPDEILEYKFLDTQLNGLYANERHIAHIFRYFSFIAVFIACLGLLGLASFSAEQRTKEVGIRKVLGATVTNVTALLSKDFVKLVLLANIVAWPVAWYAMNRWLENFAYRIEISWWMFVLAGGLALAIALLTVSTQAVRAALANPVESLRYE